MNVEKVTILRDVERAATALALSSIVENIRIEAQTNGALREDLQHAVLESLDVSVDDFMSEILDQSRTYKGMRLTQQIRTFLATRIANKVPHAVLGASEDAAFLNFLKEISIPSEAQHA